MVIEIEPIICTGVPLIAEKFFAFSLLEEIGILKYFLKTESWINERGLPESINADRLQLELLRVITLIFESDISIVSLSD